ncbi:hypothetical protein Sste5346_001477 [Sporothrix stenoceras]|uniref:Heterokaryon incompatibility domain-containing protein n=1 Tax=Sporothrix stenoceras TaxID=5173 RepID=A0ABR3ZP72_9PEZI
MAEPTSTPAETAPTTPVASGTGVYIPIKSDFEIRLLELLPSTADDDDDIVRVELHSARLDKLLSFEAISYCWGDPTDVMPILCNGEPLDITVSLYGALRRFRPRAGEPKRTLWADAICIQQTNLAEKASQVMHMPHVYSRADRVLVWLGEDNNDPWVAKVPDNLKEALGFLPDTPLDTEGVHKTTRHVYSEAQELQRQGKPNFLDHDWSPIVRLVERPWFRRKWIVQEVCLAQDILVACGRVTFPWAHLAEVAYNTMAAGILQVILGNTSLVQHLPLFQKPGILTDDDKEGSSMSNLTSLVFQNIQIMRMIRTFRHVGNLLDCIMATPLFECTDPRDHIYAVLSLPVYPTSHQLRPNYTLTTEQVLTAFAVATLVGEQNLKLLGLCPQLSRPRRIAIPRRSPALPPVPAEGLLPGQPIESEHFIEGAGSILDPTMDSVFTRADPLDLPSWVPNLTGMGIINPFTCYSVLPQLFHAGGPITPPVSVSGDNSLLYLQAKVVDTLATVLPRGIKYKLPSDDDIAPYLNRFDDNQGLARTQMWHRNWLLACKNFLLDVDINSPASLPMTPEQWLTFAKIMTCEQNNRRDSMPPAVYEAFDEYVLHILGVFEDDTKAVDEAAAANIELMMIQFGVMIESSVLTMSSMRLLGRTASGRLCQVPIDAEIGDSIVVVIGAETPFVMRQDEEPVDKLKNDSWQPGEKRFKLVGDCYVSGIMQGEILDDPQYETRQITVQ